MISAPVLVRETSHCSRVLLVDLTKKRPVGQLVIPALLLKRALVHGLQRADLLLLLRCQGLVRRTVCQGRRRGICGRGGGGGRGRCTGLGRRAPDWVEAPGSAGALAVQPDSTAARVNIAKPAAAVRRCRCLAVMVSPNNSGRPVIPAGRSEHQTVPWMAETKHPRRDAHCRNIVHNCLVLCHGCPAGKQAKNRTASVGRRNEGSPSPAKQNRAVAGMLPGNDAVLRGPPVGFEPTTPALQERCSGQLS